MLRLFCKALSILVVIGSVSTASLAQDSNTDPTLTAPKEQASLLVSEQLNNTIQDLSKQLLPSIDFTKTYAIKTFDEEASGIPADIINQINSAVQAALIKYSGSEIKIIDQNNLEHAWKNAIEFNGADFEYLAQSANFDYLILVSSRATVEGLELSLQVIGANSENSGQTASGTEIRSVSINWEEYISFNPRSLNEKLDLLLQKTEDAPVPEKAAITYEVFDQEDSAGLWNPEGDQVIATINGKRYVAFKTDLMDRLEDVRDFDNDGLKDALVYNTEGGNAIGPTYYLVSYRGEGNFSTNELTWSWVPPEIVADGPRWVLRFRVVGAGVANGDIEEQIETYKFQNNQLINDAAETALEFSEKDFTFEQAYQAISEGKEPRNGDRFEWKFDFSQDGSLDTLSCELWVRWGVLYRCHVNSNGHIIKLQYAVPTEDPGQIGPQCKTIRIVPIENENRKKIMCDFEEILLDGRSDAEFYQADWGQRVEIQSMLKAWGFYEGGIDGEWDIRSQVAIKNLLESVSGRYGIDGHCSQDYQDTIIRINGRALEWGLDVYDIGEIAISRNRYNKYWSALRIFIENNMEISVKDGADLFVMNLDDDTVYTMKRCLDE